MRHPLLIAHVGIWGQSSHALWQSRSQNYILYDDDASAPLSGICWLLSILECKKWPRNSHWKLYSFAIRLYVHLFGSGCTGFQWNDLFLGAHNRWKIHSKKLYYWIVVVFVQTSKVSSLRSFFTILPISYTHYSITSCRTPRLRSLSGQSKTSRTTTAQKNQIDFRSSLHSTSTQCDQMESVADRTSQKVKKNYT